MFFKLALRNVLRNRRRTLITEAAIVIGLVAMIFMGSYLHGLRTEWAADLIASVSGHLTLTRSDYLERSKSRPLKLTLTDAKKLYSALDADPAVESAVARLDMGGLIGTGAQSTTFFGQGVDLERLERTLPKAFQAVVEGRKLEAKDTYGAVIGVRLAENLKAKPGDTLLVATNTIDGQMNAIEVVVRGLLRTGEEIIDDNYVITSLPAVQELLAMPGRASEINLRMRPGHDLDRTAKRLTGAMVQHEPRATVKNWMEVNKDFGKVKVMFDGIAYIVGVILFFIVGAGVANTMVMSAFERTKEIGTVRAIGTTRRQVVWMFLLEALVIGAIGIIVGVAIGGAATLVAGKVGVPFPAPPGATQSFTIHPSLSLAQVLGASALVLIMSLLAAIFPARFAARLDPIEALRRS